MTTTAVEWVATREAQDLGHHWVGEEHLLLAVAEEAGRDRDDLVTALADHLERYGPPVPKVGEGCMSAPSYHMIRGRAEGLALSEGMAAPEARHVLQALLWDPRGVPALLLDRPDATASPMPLNPLLAPAEREAVAMGYPFFGAEHVVLALLAGQPDDLAGQALGACGLDHNCRRPQGATAAGRFTCGAYELRPASSLAMTPCRSGEDTVRRPPSESAATGDPPSVSLTAATGVVGSTSRRRRPRATVGPQPGQLSLLEPTPGDAGNLESSR